MSGRIHNHNGRRFFTSCIINVIKPKYLSEFIKKQKETDADIVTGTRYTNGGGKSF